MFCGRASVLAFPSIPDGRERPTHERTPEALRVPDRCSRRPACVVRLSWLRGIDGACSSLSLISVVPFARVPRLIGFSVNQRIVCNKKVAVDGFGTGLAETCLQGFCFLLFPCSRLSFLDNPHACMQQVGLIQLISCDTAGKALQLSCHMLEGTICELIRHCGDDRWDVVGGGGQDGVSLR